MSWRPDLPSSPAYKAACFWLLLCVEPPLLASCWWHWIQGWIALRQRTTRLKSVCHIPCSTIIAESYKKVEGKWQILFENTELFSRQMWATKEYAQSMPKNYPLPKKFSGLRETSSFQNLVTVQTGQQLEIFPTNWKFPRLCGGSAKSTSLSVMFPIAGRKLPRTSIHWATTEGSHDIRLPTKLPG